MQKQLLKFLTRFFPRLGKLDAQNKDMVRRTFNSMFLRVVRTGISFGFNVLLARTLGAEGAGVYALAYTITRISSIVGRIGMDQAVLRFTAANASQQKWSEVRGVYAHSMLITTLLSALITVVIFFAAPLLAIIFQEDTLTEPMRWMSLTILPMSWTFMQAHLLQGIEKIEDAIFVQTMGVPIVNIPFLILLGGVYGVTGAAMSLVLSTAIIAFLGMRLWKRYTPELAQYTANFDRDTLLKTSYPLFWTDMTLVFIGLSDVLLLGVFKDSATVGIYDQAKRISVLVSAFLGATSYVAAPKFAAMYAKGELDKLGRLARNAARLSVIVSLPYIIVFLLFPGWIMGIYGEEFVQGAPVLVILAIGQFINAATGAVGFLLVMTGHEKIMRNITLSTNALKVILFFVLIPPFGFIGAALATAIGDSTRNILAFLQVYDKLKIITIPVPDRVAKWLAARSPAAP
jgi:O-antigen/teichoic acid export membrane protein